ncbi:hypothetical protein L6452_14159 [Arctium lappa]|uniref:Uncharacterized protein n=1 Tax=Arctium lappa TaxID=4217 RepID=A0ACB9CK47_ARCLA|nr:hypothetical protein L6452_14159 [Arctium lappa]
MGIQGKGFMVLSPTLMEMQREGTTGFGPKGYVVLVTDEERGEGFSGNYIEFSSASETGTKGYVVVVQFRFRYASIETFSSSSTAFTSSCTYE